MTIEPAGAPAVDERSLPRMTRLLNALLALFALCGGVSLIGLSGNPSHGTAQDWLMDVGGLACAAALLAGCRRSESPRIAFALGMAAACGVAAIVVSLGWNAWPGADLAGWLHPNHLSLTGLVFGPILVALLNGLALGLASRR